MNEPKKKISVAILGAGAMGCLYASYLARNPELDLILLDHNPDKVAALRKSGITVVENGRERNTLVEAALSGCDHSPVDRLLIFVKAHQTYAALNANRSLMGPNTLVLSLQNGMNNYVEITKFVPLERVVIGTSNHNSTLLGPGRILHAADGKTIIGSFEKNEENVESVQGLFAGTGLNISASPDVRRLIWRKLFVNMAINPLTMLLEVRNGFLQTDRHSWDCVNLIVEEGLAVAAADGVEFDREEILELIHKICLVTGSGCSSMYQDRIHRRNTEIDFINGAVVKLARKYHLSVPYNALLVKLVHALEDSLAQTPVDVKVKD